jgi:ketosteroid isomerase-like protein
LAANELSYGHSGGTLQNKQEFIHGFTSGSSVFVSIEFTNQTISIVKNTAIVRHILTASTNDKGKGPGTVKLGVLLVWIKNDAGEWQLLARQAVHV